MKGRKGMVASITEWIPRILVLSLVFMGSLLIVNIYTNRTIDTRYAQSEILFNRLIYSPNTFWEKDAYNNSKPGIIVLDQLEDDVIESSIQLSDERYGAARISVLDENGVVEKVAYLNRQRYRNWEPLAEARVQGSGSAWVNTKRMPVTIVDEERRQGTAEFKIIIPNS